MASRFIACAIAAALLAAAPQAVLAAGAPPAAESGRARQLLQGCLQPPTAAGVAQLAKAVGAKPYSNARNRRALVKPQPTVLEDPPGSGEVQRTEVTPTAFLGWDLPGAGAGSLEYAEELSRIDRLAKASGEALEATRYSRDRSCNLQAPVANGRAMFELYETLHDDSYGLLVTADRRGLYVFRFDPDHYDIELSLKLDAPIPGLAPSKRPDGPDRLVLTDGGPRLLGADTIVPGEPIVSLTRAALLAALDRPADMALGNSVIERSVQRLAAAAARH